MELFEEIRRGYAAGETILGLAKQYQVHRRRLPLAPFASPWMLAKSSGIDIGVRNMGMKLEQADGERSPAGPDNAQDELHDRVRLHAGLKPQPGPKAPDSMYGRNLPWNDVTC